MIYSGQISPAFSENMLLSSKGYLSMQYDIRLLWETMATASTSVSPQSQDAAAGSTLKAVQGHQHCASWYQYDLETIGMPWITWTYEHAIHKHCQWTHHKWTHRTCPARNQQAWNLDHLYSVPVQYMKIWYQSRVLLFFYYIVCSSFLSLLSLLNWLMCVNWAGELCNWHATQFYLN